MESAFFGTRRAAGLLQQLRMDINCRLSPAKLFESYTGDVLPGVYLHDLPQQLRQIMQI
jgi:hypothetical protein